MKNYLIFTTLLLIFSCEKDEIPITPHLMGEIKTTQIDMGDDYSKQVFFNLEKNEVVSENLKTKWDIAFEASESGYNIILNSSKFSKVSEITNMNFLDNVLVQNLDWQWENPNGINYGSAIGDYTNKNSFYVVDNGFNLNGINNGFTKFIIDSVNNNFYKIRYSNLDNTNQDSATIYKDNNKNFIFFSFQNKIVDIEPEKNNWDLVFTQYTHLFNNPLFPPSYLVTGVLTNYVNNVEVTLDTTTLFEEINYENINSLIFSDKQNEIGYNWKNWTGSEYTLNTNYTYVIKSVSDRYFKLRFIDFYNSSGERGFPTFEFQEL